MGINDEMKITVKCTECGEESHPFLREVQLARKFTCACGTTHDVPEWVLNEANALDHVEELMSEIGAKRIR